MNRVYIRQRCLDTGEYITTLPDEKEHGFGKVSLNLCIFMDFPIHICVISMRLAIVNFKGHR